MGFFILLLITSIYFPSPTQAVERVITNPRQNRTHTDNYPPGSEEYSKILDFLTDFEAYNHNFLQDFDQPCDVAEHEKWVWSGAKDLLSGEIDKSFSHSTRWHNKICDFFKYLDCINGKCKCAHYNRYNLSLGHSDADDAAHDKDKIHLKHKRRCRVKKDELCNYVRIEAGSHPGVDDISIPDFFECMESDRPDETIICTSDVDSSPENMVNGRYMVSQTCQVEKSARSSSPHAIVPELSIMTLFTIIAPPLAAQATFFYLREHLLNVI